MIGKHAVRLPICRIFDDNPFEMHRLARPVKRTVGKQERMYICRFFIAVVWAVRPEIPVGTERIAMGRKYDAPDVLLAFFYTDRGFAVFIRTCFAYHLV